MILSTVSTRCRSCKMDFLFAPLANALGVSVDKVKVFALQPRNSVLSLAPFSIGHLVSPDRVPPREPVYQNTIISTQSQACFQYIYLSLFLYTCSQSTMGLPSTARQRSWDLLHCRKFPRFQHAMDRLHASIHIFLHFLLYHANNTLVLSWVITLSSMSKNILIDINSFRVVMLSAK